MNTYSFVRPEHLNHHGFLFGGQMLYWVDENAWLTAARDFPGFRLVTRGMDRISFEEPVPLGAILRFCVLPAGQGNSSIRYKVDVFADVPGGVQEKLVFSTVVTFVSVSCDGEKITLPKFEKLRSELDNYIPADPPEGTSGGPAGTCPDPEN